MATGKSSVPFVYASFIRGFHVYRDIWTPEIGEKLACAIDKNNIHDSHAVGVLKDGEIVGHIPREISRVFFFFLKRGGNITVSVTEKPINRGLVLGLELPATYVFSGKSSDVGNLPKLLKN